MSISGRLIVLTKSFVGSVGVHATGSFGLVIVVRFSMKIALLMCQQVTLSQII